MNTMPAFEGIVSMLGLYLLGRELFGRRVALFALTLLVGSLTHIHFSRVVDAMEPQVTVVWCFYFLVLGIRHGGAWHFALAGVLAGLTLYTYWSGRVVVPLALFLIGLSALYTPRALWKRRWGLVAGGIGFLIVFGPALVFYSRNPEVFMARTNEVSILNEGGWNHLAGKYNVQPSDTAGVLLGQLDRTALALWRYGDGSLPFGIGRNMLDPVSGTLMILSLGLVAWNFRHPAMIFLASWIALCIVAVALTQDPPTSTRLLGMIFPVALLCGLALDRLLTFLPAGREWSYVALGIGLATCLASGVWNWQDYVEWANDGGTALPRMQIVRVVEKQPHRYALRIVSREWRWTDTEFVFHLSDRNGGDTPPEMILTGQPAAFPSVPVLYLIHGDSLAVVPVLQARYPKGRFADLSLPPTKEVVYGFFTE
jgi:hypothetical protein